MLEKLADPKRLFTSTLMESILGLEFSGLLQVAEVRPTGSFSRSNRIPNSGTRSTSGKVANLQRIHSNEHVTAIIQQPRVPSLGVSSEPRPFAREKSPETGFATFA